MIHQLVEPTLPIHTHTSSFNFSFGFTFPCTVSTCGVFFCHCSFTDSPLFLPHVCCRHFGSSFALWIPESYSSQSFLAFPFTSFSRSYSKYIQGVSVVQNQSSPCYDGGTSPPSHLNRHDRQLHWNISNTKSPCVCAASDYHHNQLSFFYRIAEGSWFCFVWKMLCRSCSNIAYTCTLASTGSSV